jgi:hypothetical protein
MPTPRVVSEKGKFQLTWEYLTVAKQGGWRCFACDDVINIGEYVASLRLNGQYYKLNPNCLEQFVSYMQIFLQISNGMEVEERPN